MILDVILFILLIFAFVRGWKRGLLWAIGSLVAVLLGALISLKLSHHLANYLIESRWLVSSHTLLISFIMVFMIVMLLLNVLLSFTDKLLDILFLGWVNKLAGAILYMVFITFVFSLVLWLTNNAGLIKGQTKSQSRFYPRVKHFAPFVIKQSSDFLPFCQNIYEQADAFTTHISGD